MKNLRCETMSPWFGFFFLALLLTFGAFIELGSAAGPK
jgi:hypothetical protein